jgi:hypothetical protein
MQKMRGGGDNQRCCGLRGKIDFFLIFVTVLESYHSQHVTNKKVATWYTACYEKQDLKRSRRDYNTFLEFDILSMVASRNLKEEGSPHPNINAANATTPYI